MAAHDKRSRLRSPGRTWRGAVVLILGLGLVLFAAATAYARVGRGGNVYTVHPLVSDAVGKAPALDANLVNGWGIAAGPTSPWWVSDNGTDRSTLYDGTGTPRPLVVEVPGGPTGIVFNGTTHFPVSIETTTAASRFLFATEAGTILGWNSAVPSANSTHALVVADRSAVGAVYKGLAIGVAPDGKNYLYATDFHNGRVDVFGEDLTLKSWSGAFIDRHLPAGYAPFGIQAIGGRLYVTFAKQGVNAHDEVDGQGFGYVDEFSMNGVFLGRVASRGRLNAPWGLAMAPASGFGCFSGCLLVGNFGDGTINAYAPNPRGVWRPCGTLRTTRGKRVVIDGLWGIGFGNGSASGPTTTLYFAAGPGGEAHGLFGKITAH